MLDGQQARLTQAALETLAVVAYRQPVSPGRVSAVRGVNVDGVMRTLLTRGLVEDAGADAGSRRPALPDHDLLPGAARPRPLDELPPLAPFLPELSEVDECLTTTRVMTTVCDRRQCVMTTVAEPVRLQKVLAAAGVGSRRGCEQLIADGPGGVDGRTVRTQGTKVDPQAAVITVDGLRVATSRRARATWR